MRVQTIGLPGAELEGGVKPHKESGAKKKKKRGKGPGGSGSNLRADDGLQCESRV